MPGSPPALAARPSIDRQNPLLVELDTVIAGELDASLLLAVAGPVVKQAHISATCKKSNLVAPYTLEKCSGTPIVRGKNAKQRRLTTATNRAMPPPTRTRGLSPPPNKG
jgi:hypothetical protein